MEMKRDKNNGFQEQYMQELGEKNDSIGKVTHEEMIENLENDVRAFEQAIEKNTKDYENWQVQFELDKKIWSLLEQPGVLRKVTPTHEFERMDEWVELQQQKQVFRNRQDYAQGEGYGKQLLSAIEESKEKLEKAKAKVTKFKGE